MLLVSLIAIATGCASTPAPLNELAAADAAIGAANEAGARDYAPMELGFAEDKRRAASEALDRRDNTVARQLALQAAADAELAEAKSRAAAGRNEVKLKTQQNAALRAELLGGEQR